LVLCELRLLSSARFDSQSLLSVILAGVARLTEKLRREALVPLGSRIRARLHTESASRDELLGCLEHLMAEAGNAGLMTAGLCQTLCDHAMGNYRVLLPPLSDNVFMGIIFRKTEFFRKGVQHGL
jgi:type II secretory pathway predicted ATPase ExeA